MNWLILIAILLCLITAAILTTVFFSRKGKEEDPPSAKFRYPDDSAAPYFSVDVWTEVAQASVFGDKESTSPEVAAARIVFVHKQGKGEAQRLQAVLDAHTRPCILLYASNSDDPTPAARGDALDRIITSHPMLARIYAKNALYVSERLRPLPIGPKWQHSSTELYGESKEATRSALLARAGSPAQVAASFAKGEREVLLMLTPMAPTHASRRPEALQSILASVEGAVMVERRMDYEDFLDSMAQAIFVLSPPGWGADCHRHWEALLMGTIPVMLSTANDSLFRGLPVVIVEDYSLLTREILLSKYEELHSPAREWDWSRLFVEAWASEFAEVLRNVN